MSKIRLKIEAELTENERMEILPITQKMSKGFNQPKTVEGLLKDWVDFVIQCKNGYDDCIEDYTNDLSVRELLQDIIEGVGPKLAKKLESYIGEWDRKFEKATRPISKPLWSISTPPKPIETMLYLRIPKKLCGDLKEDLRIQEIIK